jgi:hypothetical protein
MATSLPSDASGAVRLYVREVLATHGDEIRDALADGSCRSCLKPHSEGGKCRRCLLADMPANSIFEKIVQYQS